MKIHKIEDFKGGWFIGNFEPSLLNTSNFEVGYKLHESGSSWPVHYHKVATEYNFLVKGRMTIQEHTLVSGDVFIIEPNEVSDPVFLEDCHVIVIKVPSVPGDKYDV